MKAQSSVEFMVLLAAVAAFAVFVLSVYGSFSARELPVFASLANSPLDGNTAAAGNVASAGYVSLYLPATTYLEEPSRAYALLRLPAGFGVSNVSIGDGGLDVLPYSYDGTGPEGIISVPIVPSNTGLNVLDINVTATDGGNSLHLLASGTTLTLESNGSQYAQNQSSRITASIIRRNESLLYGLSPRINVSAITQGSGCTMMNFWDQVWPIQMQCGAAAWQVRAYDAYCYDTRGTTITYCFYSSGSGRSVQKVDYAYDAAYNITLLTHMEGGSLSANLSSRSGTSRVYMGGTSEGNATVDGNVIAFGPDPSQGLVLVRSNSVYLANMSYYAALQQYMDSAEGILAYYNNTLVDASQLSSIQQAVSAYDSYVDSAAPAPSGSPCAYVNASGTVSCPPSQAFIYGDILERLGGAFRANATLYFEGSRISIR